MRDYLQQNASYWEKGYTAPNVESVVFRIVGRTLKSELNLGHKNERAVDFGCGQGATAAYLHLEGFQVQGVDISKTDISTARIRYPHIADRFQVCAPNPADNDYYGWENEVALVMAIQSLYYFSKSDFDLMIDKLYKAMSPGAILFTTMMSTKHAFYQYSKATSDPWLRETNFDGPRIRIEKYYNFFVEDREDMCSRFSMFEPIHCGEYMMQLQEGDTNNHHLTFLGRKPG